MRAAGGADAFRDIVLRGYHGPRRRSPACGVGAQGLSTYADGIVLTIGECVVLSSLIRRGASAALLACGALGAQADTVQFNGFHYGNGNAVTINAPVSLSANAGGFDLSFNGAASVVAYCVELTQYIGLGQSYGNYAQLDAADYFSAGTLDRLARLISFVEDHHSVNTALESSALQLAIWNIVYDVDATVGSGSFRVGANGFSAMANQWLADSGNSAASGWALYVLKSDTQQDQLYWARQSVPEPATLALAAAALGGMGFASRRRRA